MMPNPRLRAVIFDLDHTLVESMIDYGRMNCSVIHELVKAGVDPSILKESRSVVENLQEGKRYLALHDPAFDPAQVDRRINALLTASEMERVASARMIPGTIEAIELLEEMGLRMAVLTRGSRIYAMKLLDLTGLDGRLGQCVCRDDHPLEEAKPNPLAMRRTASLIGVHVEDCVYAGDHPMDLECATAAGARFVGVLTGNTTRERWKEHGCELVIPSVAALPRLLRESRL